MWLIRVIIIMIVFWFIVMLLGWMIRRALIRKFKSFQRTSQKGSSEKDQKALVPCASCGTYIEKDKAITKQGEYYCCEEHT